MSSKRRARGDGGLRQRPDGYWEATVSLGYVEGRRKRKVFTGRTQAEVRRKRDDWLRGNRGQLPVDGHMTVDQWFEQHFIVRHHLRPITVRDYRSVHDTYVSPLIGDMPLDKVKQAQIDGLIVKMMAAGIQTSTLRRYHATVNAMFNLAEKRGKIAANPCRHVELPPMSDVERTVLDIDEVRALLAALEGTLYWAPLTFVAYTGLRISEASGLMMRHVRLDDDRVDVRWRLLRAPGGVWDWEECKSATSRRTVPLLDEARVALETSKGDGRMVPPPPPHSDGLLAFSRSTGNPIEQGEVNKALRRGAKRADVRRVTVHELRHSAGSFMLNAGVPLWLVSRLMGHANQSMTEKVYAHVLDSGTDAAAKALAAYMKGDT